MGILWVHTSTIGCIVLRHSLLTIPSPPVIAEGALWRCWRTQFFRHFLQQHGGGAEVQLLFWSAVEDMKSSMGNERTCRWKTRTIQQRFFHGERSERMTCLGQIADVHVGQVAAYAAGIYIESIYSTKRLFGNHYCYANSAYALMWSVLVNSARVTQLLARWACS